MDKVLVIVGYDTEHKCCFVRLSDMHPNILSEPVFLSCRVGVLQVLLSPEPPPTPPPAAVTAAMSPPAAAPRAWTVETARPCLGSLRAQETHSHTHTPRQSHKPPGDWCIFVRLHTETCLCFVSEEALFSVFKSKIAQQLYKVASLPPKCWKWSVTCGKCILIIDLFLN